MPAGEGWFVVNAREARWFASDGLGVYTQFEGPDARFAQFGFNVAILHPGEPSSMYHGEDAQEDFLVLAGECLLIVEGEERLLRRGTSSTARTGRSTSSSALATGRASWSPSACGRRAVVSGTR